MLGNYDKELKDVKKEIASISLGLLQANELILDALETCDKEKFNEAKSHISNTTNKTNEIDNNIIKLLALYAPEARDLRQVVAYLKITNELLRASTNTRSFIKGFMNVCKFVDIDTIKEYAIPLQSSTIKAIKIMTDMIDMDCADDLQDSFNEVLIEENKTDDLYEILESTILKQSKETDDFEKIHQILRAFRKSAKIADRAISVANLLVYVKVGGILQKV